MSNITLDEIARGALLEQFNSEFERVAENIYDPNTKATAVRKIQMTLTFKPSEDRDFVTTDIQTKSTLSPISPVQTRFMIGKDHKTNKIVAEEYGKDQMKGQLKIDDLDTDYNIAEDGEIIDDVIDYKKVRKIN